MTGKRRINSGFSVQHISCYLNNHLLFTSALFVAIFMICSMTLITPRYIFNDDWTISAYLSGLFGETTPYFTFVNVLLGYILQAVFVLFGNWGLNWFTLYQYAILFCSFWAIAYILLSSGSGRGRYWLTLLFGLICVPHFSTQLSFTITAGVGCFAGLFLMFILLRRKSNPVLLLFPALLTVGASFLRINCFLLVLPYIGFLIVAELFSEKSHSSMRGFFKNAAPYLVCFGVIIAVVIGTHIYYNWTLANWDAGFVEFNKARYLFNDYPREPYTELENGLRALGVSFTDYDLINSWVFADPDFFTTELLQAIIDMQPPINVAKNITSFFVNYSHHMMHPTYLAAIMLGTALLFLSASSTHSKLQTPILVLSLFLAVNTFGLFFVATGRITDAVRDSMFFPLPCLMLYLMGRDVTFHKMRPTNMMAAGLCSVLLFLQGNTDLAVQIDDDYINPQFQTFYGGLGAQTDNVYTTTVSFFEELSSAHGVFRLPPAGSFSNIVPLGGWGIGHPLTTKQNE